MMMIIHHPLLLDLMVLSLAMSYLKRKWVDLLR